MVRMIKAFNSLQCFIACDYSKHKFQRVSKLDIVCYMQASSVAEDRIY